MLRPVRRHPSNNGPPRRRSGNPPSAPQALEPRVLMAVTPNDPEFREQWALREIGAPDNWADTTGSAAVIVAHIDSGVDYTHPDLYKNVWLNMAEVPPAVRPGLLDVDRDGKISFWDLNHVQNSGRLGAADVNGNGYFDAGDALAPYEGDGAGGWADGVNGKNHPGDKYVDDLIGWDFANNDNNPYDFDGHGTHTAGVIGAIGNNGVGVTGVAWKVRLMALKVFRDDGRGAKDTDIAEAVRYAADNGARVSNNSYGGPGGRRGDTLYRAIHYAADKGHLFVAAAGNQSRNNDRSARRSYPASYDLSNILAVASSDTGGGLSWYSNYGARSVDVAAPGDSILSTLPAGRYGTMDGTSMAAPHVAGTAALLLSGNAGLTTAQLKGALLVGADSNGYLARKSTSGGRLNARKSYLASTGPSFAEEITPVRAARAIVRGRARFFPLPTPRA
jgi:serine protease